ncbi:hypothetical protein AYO44_03925 [Planctomycetaceae bacterium SCGC AG-212-F19]|nr:hypothetical protein AYO44_03925 [Planctomycetaceae bacterium SCGC AG-212-F19]
MIRPDHRPIRVVVVAQSSAIGEQLAEVLRQAGYEPVQASSSREALALIHDGTPGVFLDPLPDPVDGISLKEIVRGRVMQLEREVLHHTLKLTGGNKAKAARILQIDYKTIHTKAKEYGLTTKKGRKLTGPDR